MCYYTQQIKTIATNLYCRRHIIKNYFVAVDTFEQIIQLYKKNFKDMPLMTFIKYVETVYYTAFWNTSFWLVKHKMMWLITDHWTA